MNPNSPTAKDRRHLGESPVTPAVCPRKPLCPCSHRAHAIGDCMNKGIIQTAQEGDSSSRCARNRFSETIYPPTSMPQSHRSLCRCHSPLRCRSPQYCGFRTPFSKWYTLYRFLACGSGSGAEAFSEPGRSYSAEDRIANSSSRAATSALSVSATLSPEQAAERGCFVKGYARG